MLNGGQGNILLPIFGVIDMKLSEAIEKVNALKAHSFDDEIIKDFIEDCDKRLYREVIETHEQSNIQPYEERYPLGNTVELLADDAYTQLYVFYAISQIDAFNGEYDRYNNNMILYNTALSDYKQYYNRTHTPKGASTFITS